MSHPHVMKLGMTRVFRNSLAALARLAPKCTFRRLGLEITRAKRVSAGLFLDRRLGANELNF